MAALSHLHTVADCDGAAILDSERGLVSTLNETGAFVWERLRRGETVDAIVFELASATGADIKVVEQDVKQFVADFNETHLKQVVRGA